MAICMFGMQPLYHSAHNSIKCEHVNHEWNSERERERLLLRSANGPMLIIDKWFCSCTNSPSGSTKWFYYTRYFSVCVSYLCLELFEICIKSTEQGMWKGASNSLKPSSAISSPLFAQALCKLAKMKWTYVQRWTEATQNNDGPTGKFTTIHEQIAIGRNEWMRWRGRLWVNKMQKRKEEHKREKETYNSINLTYWTDFAWLNHHHDVSGEWVNYEN